jgi:SAM-dependent methyltransferase
MRDFLKRAVAVPLAHAVYKGKPLLGLARYVTVLEEFRAYRRLVKQAQTGEAVAVGDLYPWLLDKYRVAGNADKYFYQDTWCARKVAETRPATHVDVGSSLLTVGIMAQYTDLVEIDLRPLPINLPGLTFQTGSLLSLPFAADSVESISSLSVVEHVGLGRYGDTLDARGTDRACLELQRVLRPGGALYVAVPTHRTPRTYFNAHRVFHPDDFIRKFPNLALTEERYATENGVMDRAEYERLGLPDAYGCFQFGKTDAGPV